ncbi:uncharacterized protein [Drosophila virilis]|uniref:Glycosyltransferase family 92 protein n=1 Tax=Drosophila virilis TaxID=7244 RepID=B4MGY7_DROVI|nr:uncharacterized protein LOC6636934 [Drosophila virilis]EDW57370.1 uncharacterized protein Dvir_GJ16335 [Drosophila virilis]
MHANHSRLIKIFLVIISIKLFLILVLFAYNNSNVNRFRPRRMVFIDELLIDKSETPSWQERLKLIREEMPSFPLEELTHRPPLKPSCGLVPSVLGIDYSNDYWQMVRVANLTYYLFGAYYDNREKMTEAPLVRVLTMINLYAKHHEVKYPETFCQLWYKNRVEPIVVSVTDHRLIWFWGGGPPQVFPTLLSCPLPKKNGTNVEEVPEMVSLVTERCEKARNLLRVVYERDVSNTDILPTASPKEQDQKDNPKPNKPLRFMVCVKAMDFLYVDMSSRLIEWLELMRLLGAGKVVFYDAQMHPNMTRVINDYIENSPDFVELRPLSMSRGVPHTGRHFHHYAMGVDNFNRILNEMIPYNDCFYRNMYKYDYVGVFDIDEIIMPLGNVTNWSDLIELAHKVPDYERAPANCTNWASFCFRNVYFPRYPERPKVYKELPSFYYMLQHVERVAEHCDRYSATKCLHSTRYVIGLHNHFPLFHAGNGECDPKSVPIEFAQLHHYREPDNKTRLIDPIIDDNIWRFQPTLQQRVYAKYKKLGFLPDISQVINAEIQRRNDDERKLQEAIGMT